MPNSNSLAIATFAGGCFWCTEAVFKRVKGVAAVVPGYAGGTRENPNYDQIHSGATGHAESIQVSFDPIVISYDQLLDVFFATHDPTMIDQQGNDVGSEYRSIIFYHDEAQHKSAEAFIQKLEEEKVHKDPIVTEVVPFTKFYEAEDEHKDYYDKNRNAPYCRVIIDPKVQKLLKKFGDEVKDEYR